MAYTGFTAQQTQGGSAPSSGNRSLYPQRTNLQPLGARPRPAQPPPAPTNGYQRGTVNNAPTALPPMAGPDPAPPQAPQAPTQSASQPASQAPAPPKLQRVDPKMSGTVASAAAQFQAHAKTILGQDLTQEQLNTIASQIGLSGDTITGAQFNQALGILESMGPQGWAGAPEPTMPTIGGGYTPTPGGTVPAPGAYTPATFTQYQPPDLSEIDGKTEAAINTLLDNPESLSPEILAKMKAGAKSTALDRVAQLRGNATTNLAGRGFAGGGMENGINAAADEELIATLLNSERDLDISAAERNRKDRIDTIGLAEDYANSRSGRARSDYGTTLGGQEAQAAEDMRAAGYNMDRWGRQQDQVNTDRNAQLTEFLASVGVDLDRQKFSEAKKQFQIATGMDLMRFLEGQRQFDVGTDENKRQFNIGAGFQTAAQKAAAEQRLMEFLVNAGII